MHPVELTRAELTRAELTRAELIRIERAPSASGVLGRLRDRLGEIQARAPELDRLGAFPQEDVRTLADLGALRAFASSEATPLELMEALRLVGRANLSLGRIFEGHVNGVVLVRRYGTSDQRARLDEDLAAGALFGVWNTEPAPGVKLVRHGRAWRLRGAKSYATGAGHVQRALITAEDPEGGRRMVLVDGAQPERADPSAWSVRGMRASCSGGYDLTDMTVDESQLIGAPGDYAGEPQFSAGAWRFTAVQLGGIERILGLLRVHLAAVEVDAVRAARFGAVLAEVRSAYLWVREAAERAQAPDAGSDEVAVVLMARGVVEKAGLAIMDAATRTVGTRAFFSDHPLDQACRDLALYLRQPAPDQAMDRAARAFLQRDAWRHDRLW
jgi:alkylation response protein AidB-like acyl-CoA dehydrogenase